MSRSRLLLRVLGLSALLAYLATATGLLPDTGPLVLALVFAIGPVAILGVLRLLASLGPETADAALRPARLFLTTAFVLFTVMVVLQQMTGMQFRALLAAAPDAGTAATLRLVWSGVNLVQLGMDVAFDIFYCLGIISLGVVLYRHRGFGRWVALPGILVAAALLVLNLTAFPRVPAEAGLVDLGPVTGAWWLVVILCQVRRTRVPAPPLAPA